MTKKKSQPNPQGPAKNPMGPPFPKPPDFRPNPTFDNGGPRCTAWARSQNRQCRQHPKKGTSKCHYHGGAGSGRPPIHGRYTNLSKFSERIQHSLNDSAQMSVRAEIGILGIRLDQLAGGLLGDGEPVPDLAELKAISKEINGAMQHADTARLQRANAALTKVVELTEAEKDGWDEYRSTTRDLAGLISGQVGRDIAQAGMVPIDDVWLYIEYFQLLMFEFIPTSLKRQSFMQKLRTMIPRPPLQTPTGDQLVEGEFTEPEEVNQ